MWLVLLPLLLLLGGGVYLLLGGRFGSVGIPDNGAAEAVARFYASLGDGKCEEAVAILAKPELTASELCDNWKAASKGTTSKGAAENVSSEGDAATVKWTMTVGDKAHKPSVSLRKADNVWKITSPISDLVPTP
jgi:hypothetical protein